MTGNEKGRTPGAAPISLVQSQADDSAWTQKQQASICRQQSRSRQQSSAAQASADVPNRVTAIVSLISFDFMVDFMDISIHGEKRFFAM